MDDGFPVEFWQSDLFWLEEAPIIPAPATQISAFLPFSNRPTTGSRQENNPAAGVNKRMVEFWRRRWHAKRSEPAAGGDLEREKCYRHMLNERMRRDKQRQSYLALHSMLPQKTKNDKNSIVQMAARRIQELKTLESMLQRRNLELETTLAEKKREKENGTTAINLAVANPSSGINSMLAVLNVLKTVGVKAKAIHASFFDAEFSAQLAIDTHMRAAEVERALQVTLIETEGKLQRGLPGRIEIHKRKPC